MESTTDSAAISQLRSHNSGSSRSLAENIWRNRQCISMCTYILFILRGLST